jgi:hypothetical protein
MRVRAPVAGIALMLGGPLPIACPRAAVDATLSIRRRPKAVLHFGNIRGVLPGFGGAPLATNVAAAPPRLAWSEPDIGSVPPGSLEAKIVG